MTDTIGWGDVDVEPRSPRRRRRVSWLVWPVLAVVVAGIALAPVVKRDLARSSMRWLQRQWALQAAYDDARATKLAATAARVGVADVPRYVRLVQAVDRQERDRLAAIDRQVAGRHTWTGDVAHARAAVQRSLHAEVRDLDHEIATVAELELSVQQAFAPSPYTSATAQSIEATDAAVLRSASAHHLGQVGRPQVRLDAGDDIVRLLGRPTDRPLPFRLVVVDAAGYVAWDLRTGSHHLVSALAPAAIGPVLPVIGGNILAQTDTSFTLVPLDGSPPRRLPRNDIYLPDGRDGLWRIRDLVAQRLSADLRPVGPARHVPSGYGVDASFNEPASTGLLIVTKFTPVDQSPGVEMQSTFAWRPADGRLMPLPDGCGAASTPTVLVSVECAGNDSSFVAVDLVTGRVHHISLGAGRSLSGGTPVLSPDGRHVAVTLARSGDPEAKSLGVAVVDLTTQHLDTISTDPRVRPVTWTPDGTTLVLAASLESFDCCTNDPGMFAYWSPGMHDLGSIRIPTTDTAPPIAVIGE